MKKTIFLLGITLTTYFSSCKDDVIGNRVENPVETGDEILFGSSLAGTGAGTRTVYGDRTDLGVPVYWKESGDDIAIFCLQSSQPADHLVNYTVKPVLDTNRKPTAIAASVTKINPEEAGLQWGPDEEHRFYAFYPATAVEGSDEENQTGKITANIPVTQQVQEWRIAETEDEGAIDGMKTYFGLPNMDYAYMYAFKKVNKSEVAKGGTIDLTFHNLVTVLDITVRGPETGEAVTVTNINVTAVDGQNPILTGDFTCNIRAAEDGNVLSATCEAAGDLNEVRNLISIPCYDKKEGKYISLRSGECLNVKAYLIPDDDVSHQIKPRTLKITVATLNGGSAKERTLEQGVVTPHKINRVLLPKLIPGGTNYWLSSLDENIYVSELSLPGSKFSVLTEANQAGKIYQTADIATQFQDGVRAFILQTATKGTNTANNSNEPENNVFTYEGFNVVAESKDRVVMPLSQAIEDIASYLDECEQAGKKNEFAFVMLTYTSGDSDWGSGHYEGTLWWKEWRWDRYAANNEQYWIEKLRDEVNSIKGDSKNRIYKYEITPETTIKDVAGKIILKANYNSETMISNYGSTTAPIMFTYWGGPFGPEVSTDVYWQEQNGGMPMNWGVPQWYLNASDAKLKWYYQEVTSVGTNQEASTKEKNDFIDKLFEEGVKIYKNSTAHDTWIMNDLGGYYSDDTDIKNRGTGIQALAIDMNQKGVNALQNRTENAGLGLIFMNFADKQSNSGTLYKSDWLIQTIIDNNFKFALRKKGSTPTRTEYVTRMSGDGWDE